MKKLQEKTVQGFITYNSLRNKLLQAILTYYDKFYVKLLFLIKVILTL
jgi:hypothetical protein